MNKKSTMISIRVPNHILNQFKITIKNIGSKSLSRSIVNAMCEIIVEYKGVNYENK